nr:MAG TPA_asm: hypothetical protein [Bacteriophage sp.]
MKYIAYINLQILNIIILLAELQLMTTLQNFKDYKIKILLSGIFHFK